MRLIYGSYLDEPFGKAEFDAAASVESLHYYSKEEKLSLYRKLCAALKKEGFFVLTDCFAQSDKQELTAFASLRALKRAQNIPENDLVHYDAPLTAADEIEVLLAAGFADATVKKSWGATSTLVALKSPSGIGKQPGSSF